MRLARVWLFCVSIDDFVECGGLTPLSLRDIHGSCPIGTTRRCISSWIRGHTLTARELNAWDDQPGRRIWFQYYDTHITYPASYYTRLKYVHQNPVHHGLVRHAGNWKWCSAGWFERRASSMFRRLLDGVQIDRVHVMDPFEPVAPGYDEDKAASSRRTPQVSPTS